MDSILTTYGDFVDVYVEKAETTRITCEDNRIEDIVSGSVTGVGVRVIKGGKTVYGSTCDLTGEGVKELVRRLCSGEKTTTFRESNIRLKKLETASCPALILPGDVPLEKKVGLVRTANGCARSEGGDKIQQVGVSYSDAVLDIVIASSSGTYTEERRVYTNFSVNVVAKKGKTVQTGHELAGGLAGFELFQRCDVTDVAGAAARRALGMLDARKMPAGEMMVVLSSEAGGTMIHEAVGHSLEADAVQKDISPAYKGKLGREVASPLITVIDDPTLPGRRGSYRFDDEGTPARRTVLIENGVLKSYLYDNYTAGKDGTVSTGNGRRESYDFKPIPRMSNTCILPGRDDPAGIIRSVPKGILVKKMGGGQVNTANGDFVFEVAEGYEIKDGRIGGMVRGACLIGNGPRILNSIDMVGTDLGFGIGTCGKDGQGVPVSDAQPTLRIPRITVGGTESA